MTGLSRQAPINDCYGAQRATAAIGPRPPIRVGWGTIAFGQSGLRVGVAHIGRDEIEEADSEKIASASPSVIYFSHCHGKGWDHDGFERPFEGPALSAQRALASSRICSARSRRQYARVWHSSRRRPPRVRQMSVVFAI